MAGKSGKDAEENPKKSSIAQDEGRVLEFWRKNKIFEKSLKKPSPKGEFVFYEGPPTANGKPGIHHVESRAFKDVVPRYKTMRGFRVQRKAGWDTHGLPVEIEVEKELNLKNKKDVEEYGIEKFNRKSKESVWKYKEDWEKMTERIGFWIDMTDPYITYKSDYIESLWWIVKQAHEKGLLYKGYKVVPNCPRCGTTLSSHEVAQGYKNIEEDSVYIKFKITGGNNEYILVWTTTPWTLPGNVALAVGEDIDYVQVEQNGERLILAKNLLNTLEGSYEVVKEMKGKELAGVEYEPLFKGVVTEETENASSAFKVYTADFVSTEDGTGIVHTAVMYGADDYELGERIGLPKIHSVNLDGTFNERVPQWQGKFVKDVEKEIIAYLKEKNILYKGEKYTHDYPFCWRCGTPLIYYAKDSWYFKMSLLKDDLIKNNETINWIPEHIKEGRFGEWLRDIKDWAVSRERYWGTPLPVWKCEGCKEISVVGSLKELLEKTEKSGNKYFVMRHGGAQSNAEGILSSKKDNPHRLTEEGRKNVLETAKKLKKEKIDLIITSPFVRTRETAELVAETLGVKDVIEDESISELKVGEFDGKSISEYHAFFSSKREMFEKKPTGGETWTELKKRTAEFLYKTDEKYSGKNILFVTHEATARMLFLTAEGADIEKAVEAEESGWHVLKTSEAKKLEFAPLPHNADYELDLHRPYIDSMELKCSCGGSMKRTPEVMDAWFDSGSMPFAQYHYPFENKELIDNRKLFPADYISEGVDQTRGWFYTLLAVSTILGKGAPYKNVISLGIVLDANGKKMSKSIGNIVDPMEMIEKYGADGLRWYFYTVNAPGDAILFEERGLREAKKVFTILYNVLAFYKMFSNNSEILEVKDPEDALDKWVLSKLNLLVKEVTGELDKYNITLSARKMGDFIMDLSQWYVRRSRGRLKSGDKTAERTLGWVLHTTSKLIAPFAPFSAEGIQRELNPENSIHLEEWPIADEKQIDEKIIAEMDAVRRIVSLALEARMDAGIKVRQPLSTLRVKKNEAGIIDNDELARLIKDEVNVKEVVFDEDIENEVKLETEVTSELKQEGQVRELVRHIQDLRKETGLVPSDKVKLIIESNEAVKSLVEKHKDEIAKVASLEDIVFGEAKKGKKVEIDEIELTLELK